MVRLKQSKLTDDEKIIMKNLALKKLHRQRLLKEKAAVPMFTRTKCLKILFNLSTFS